MGRPLHLRIRLTLLRSPIGQQVVDIRTNLGWVVFPFLQPMPVDFPARAGDRTTVAFAPSTYGRMRLVEEMVGAEVYG